MALISITQEDNDKTYALSRSDSVELNTTLSRGFKVRFIKTSLATSPSTISSTIGIRGFDHTQASISSMTLTHPNDTVEFMYDDVNTCFQITEYRRADIPAVIDDIKTRVAFTDRVNLFTAGQSVQPVRIVGDDLQPDEAIILDAAISNSLYITLGSTNHPIQKPTNLVDGTTVNFVISHTINEGGQATFGSGFWWANGGNPPTLSNLSASVDIVSCYYAVPDGHSESDGILMCSVAYNMTPTPA